MKGNVFILHAVLLLPRLFQNRRGRYLQRFRNQIEDIVRKLAGGQMDIVAALAVNARDIVLVVDHEAGGHELLQDGGVDVVLLGSRHVRRDAVARIAVAAVVDKVIFDIRSLQVGHDPRAGDLHIAAVGKYFSGRVHYGEGVGKSADGLGLAEEEIAAVLKRLMKDREEVVLQHRLKVD